MGLCHILKILLEDPRETTLVAPPHAPHVYITTWHFSPTAPRPRTPLLDVTPGAPVSILPGGCIFLLVSSDDPQIKGNASPELEARGRKYGMCVAEASHHQQCPFTGDNVRE